MKVFLNSYLNNNLGDDLMIDIMCKRYPNHQFYISNINRLSNIACKSKNLHIVSSISPTGNQYFQRAINKGLSYLKIPKLQVIKEFTKGKYDVYMELGGSIFMQVTKKSWINKVRDSQYVIKNCNHNFIVSSNFGPYQTEAFKDSYGKLFSQFDDVIFRDEYSYSLFSNLDSVRICPDIVYNLDCKSSPEDIVGVSVISLDNVGVISNKDIYIQGLVDLINEIGKEKKIVLFSFCENEGDLETCKVIKENCDDNIDIEIYNHVDLDESINYMSKFSAMICTRFHACVMAVNLKIPFLPVIYSKKTDNMLDGISYNGYRWRISEGESLNLNAAINSLIKLEDIDYSIKEKCKNHFIKLDMILTK